MAPALRQRILAALAGALLACAPAAMARAADVPAWQLEAWLGAGLVNFDYEEFDRGVSLDREEGYLPGAGAGLRLGRDRLFAETVLGVAVGRVDYASATATTTTDEDVRDWSALAGYTLVRGDAGTLGLHAGLGYHRWERDIRSTPAAFGLDETYTWWYGSLGLRTESRVTDRVRFRADFQLRRSVDPAIDVRFKSGHDATSLDLGEANGLRAAFTLERSLDGGIVLYASPWFEYWRLGRSKDALLTRNGVPAGTVFEPQSETHNLGVEIGVRWRVF